jgi:hypothetical protein
MIYKEYFPANAEVIVDYSKPKGEMVTFNFVRKDGYWNHVFTDGMMTFFKFQMILLFYFLVPFLFILSALFNDLYSFINHIQTSIFLQSLVVAFVCFPYIFNIFFAIDKKRYCDFYPKFNYYLSWFFSGKSKLRFTPSSVNNKAVIIPFFSNVYLKYDSSGDMGKHLSKIEIKSHRYIWEKNSIGKKKDISDYKNSFRFYAIFHFSRRPKDGFLEVEFI